MTIQNINFAQYAGKTDGTSTLSANEWNTIMSDLDTVVDAIPESSSQSAGGSDSGIVSAEVDPSDADKTIVKVNDVTVGELTVKGQKGTNVTLSGNNNINIEPRPAAGTGEDKNTPGLANRKGGNISLKPGDDIELCSHKRGTGKNTEVAVKVIDGSENPVKLQVFAGDITLSTKGKGSTKKKDATTGEDTQELLYDDPNVMNVNVTTGNGKGYLKVRAQAIDLRCEDRGGIALQPKGNDGQGHENKIKFEHGGGDGLEFGTFNTYKTSIYTDEYRFMKNGDWKMATRQKELSDKRDSNDQTTNWKYVKQADDFYDIIDNNDPTATTEDIIKAGNIVKGVGVSVNNGIISLADTYVISSIEQAASGTALDYEDVSYDAFTINDVYTEEQLLRKLDEPVLPVDWFQGSDTQVIAVVGQNQGEVYNISITIVRPSAMSCSLDDIVKLTAYMKRNNQGPWANA